MIGKKINQLATELAPVSTDLTIIGDPISGVSKKITLAQLGAIFSGAVSFYNDLASFPATGDINVIYCAKDTKKLYLWSGSAYVEVFPSQALLDTYQLRSEKGVSNGYASLDSGGKVPISQLPSSIMEYKGMWNAATNTPTLANGTGDTGDVYICNVAGTVDFGAGPITFAVGDYTIYSGSIWQRSSGAVGTVTSVSASITGDAIGITGSPVTTSGTLALAFAGTSSQYINGAGNLTTFPTLTGYVPYTGATANVDLGTHTLSAKDLVINHSSGSGVAASITKGGAGEALTVVKSSGSGNAASITGGVTLLDELHLNTDLADTYIASASNWNAAYNDKINSAAVTGTTTKTLTLTQQDGGTITASWTDDNTDAVTSVFGRTGAVVAVSGDYNTSQVTENTNLYYTEARVNANTNVAANTAARHNAVTIGTANGLSLSTQVLSLALASGSTTGALSSTDWTTFNNKQSALTNPVTGSGTTNYLPKFTGTSTIGNSIVYDDGSGIGITGSAYATLTLNSTNANGWGTNINFQQSGTAFGYVGAYGSLVGSTTKDMTIWANSGNGFRVNVNNSSTSALILNTSGNLGLGVTPSAWNSDYVALQFGAKGLLYGRSGGEVAFGTNWYRSSGGSFLYATNGFASYQAQADGVHYWFQAPSGTAGNAISFTQAMTLNASGNLSVGNTNDTYKLDVTGTGRFTGELIAGGGRVNIQGTNQNAVWFNQNAGGTSTGYLVGRSYTTTDSQDFFIYDVASATRVLAIASTGAATFSSSVTAGGIVNSPTYFFRSINPATESGIETTIIATGNGENIRAGIFATNNYAADVSTSLIFKTNGSSGSATERMRITSGGRVGIGQTSPGTALSVAGQTEPWQLALTSVTGTAGAIIGSPSANVLAFGDWGGTERMRITSGGNVGIGTTSPYAKFQVFSTATSPSLTVGTAAAAIISCAEGQELAITANGTAPYGISFQGRNNNGGGPSGTSYPIIFNPLGGNVGIGTTSPTNGKLEIQTGATTSALWVQTGGTTSSYVIADFRTGTNLSALQILGNGAATFSSNIESTTGSIKTGEPDTGYGRAAVKIGARNTGEAFTSAGYIPVNIDGTVYFINLYSDLP